MKHLHKFILYNVAFFVIFFYVVLKVNNLFLQKKNKKPVNIIEFLNRGNKNITLFSKKMMLGFVFGIVFGFIDTISLWIGIDELQRYFPGGVLTKAAFSNIYADTIAATISTTISVTLMDHFKNDLTDIPIWANSIAIMIGCVIGLITGRLVTNKV